MIGMKFDLQDLDLDEGGAHPPWASYRNGRLIGRDHSEQAAQLRQAAHKDRDDLPN
jgi:hypothetical protein